MSDLDERAERAVMETSVCGIEIDGVRMLCCDERAKGRPGYWKPEDCHCRNSARAVRTIALEEAAKVAEKQPHPTAAEYYHGIAIADAIRKLGEE
jgi:hypothetical protein